MASPETELAEFAATLTFAEVPDDARETVRRAFLDTAGVTLAGAVEGAGETTFEALDSRPDDGDVAATLGLTTSASAAERALRTGTASHALDYDDLSWAMDGHPSVTLVPALFALAGERGASGEALVAAYAAGFEVECALADPISPDHYEAGWHATATFGAFGAAAAVASLLDLDTEETRHALNVAASTPAGLKRNFGSMTKPLHAGLCARSGVTAALLAENGFTADATAVSGDRGFWDLYGPEERDEFAFDPDEWALETEGIHVKYYPCCYFTHTSIAATQALVEEHGVDPEDVERIQVRAAQGAADALHHVDPETGLEAKFSMEYAVASGAVRERVGLATFEDDAIDDATVQRVRERVEFSVDESFHYDSHEAVVRIETADGTYERRQENPPGTHGDPLTESELREKFAECAGRAVPDTAVDRLADTLLTLDDHPDVADALAE
ncbi:MmgE/PrpD family protein [Halomarina salina]|uniref:MmgE/PrpD family protein n=1 Tax=Halomarina salina TaxID=1872699 RepID=A0ABD5RT48_9EURY|nr:MmgE/PrpD family protein [Halomarina salina]